jgi:vacuolar-type H+-ATPase subunit H
MADLHVPYVDTTTLRLDSELELQKEKMRRKVRDARIRAKLSRYRAERIASKFEDKFGFYPEEDIEEAQTEVENSSDD